MTTYVESISATPMENLVGKDTPVPPANGIDGNLPGPALVQDSLVDFKAITVDAKQKIAEIGLEKLGTVDYNEGIAPTEPVIDLTIYEGLKDET
jgi:hypothetical protein